MITKSLNFDRRARPGTRRLQTIADVKQAFGLSDLELTDVYNAHYGTVLPCPIPDKLALLARNAARKMRDAEAV